MVGGAVKNINGMEYGQNGWEGDAQLIGAVDDGRFWGQTQRIMDSVVWGKGRRGGGGWR